MRGKWSSHGIALLPAAVLALAALVIAVAALAAATPGTAQAPAPPLLLDAGDGTQLRTEHSPTRVLADGGSLPFTGLELLWGALSALALLASGVALRRLGCSATPAQEDREHQRRDRAQHADAQHADPQHEPQDPSA